MTQWLQLESEAEMGMDDVYDGGVAVMDEEAHRVVMQEFNRGLVVWLAGGLCLGILSVPVLIYKTGTVSNMVTPRQAGAWLGTCLGTAIQSFLLQITIPMFLPDAYAVAARYTFVTIAYLSVIGFFGIRNLKQKVVDPGPPYHILGLRNTAEFGSWMLKLELPKRESPPLGTVPRDGPSYSVGKVGRLVSATHNKNSMMSLGLIFAVNIVSMAVSLAYSSTAWWVSVLQLPLTASVFMGNNYYTCKAIDSKLHEVNMEPTMLRRNLCWVLRRTRLTLLYSLWLVRRDPFAHVISSDWTKHYKHCTVSFRRAVKLLLLVTSTHSDHRNWLPQDVIFLVFGYLASSDSGQRHTKKCQKVLI
eukprot:TRINITY_DN874_c0_g1_i8.p1 TRINITY_DN874_c0_g1~~TRINITY_DN874_c0_g1_i8.p1  ORF type:complete len:359 (+),score=28.39 TRINITY_DN874_c0_g1_i8:50-1126(+)